jgi:hypothetical protein
LLLDDAAISKAGVFDDQQTHVTFYLVLWALQFLPYLLENLHWLDDGVVSPQ